MEIYKYKIIDYQEVNIHLILAKNLLIIKLKLVLEVHHNNSTIAQIRNLSINLTIKNNKNGNK